MVLVIEVFQSAAILPDRFKADFKGLVLDMFQSVAILPDCCKADFKGLVFDMLRAKPFFLTASKHVSGL
jgi:hypothetical protein